MQVPYWNNELQAMLDTLGVISVLKQDLRPQILTINKLKEQKKNWLENTWNIFQDHV